MTDGIHIAQIHLRVRGLDVEYSRALARSLGPDIARRLASLREGDFQGRSVERIDVPIINTMADLPASAASDTIATQIVHVARARLAQPGDGKAP